MTASPNTPRPTPTPDLRPTSTITSPNIGGIVTTSSTVNITGTASGAGGRTVQSVQVSVDGGATYSPATGATAWSFVWSPSLPGQTTIKSRAIDTSGGQQDPPAEVTVTVRDVTPPTSTIMSPKAGAVISTTTTVSITGTASDTGGGKVARVDVSVDGGATYSPATGTTTWSFNWTPPTPGPATIRSRAVDDSGNQQDPPAVVTVTVPIRVPLDQPTIRSAINVASDGDTVLVAPGTYLESAIDFKKKAITVTSESGPKDTIIDGLGENPIFVFTSGEGRGSVLNGFTLEYGRKSQFLDGGDILIRESSPTITGNVITNNYGGGIYIDRGSPLIQRNTITNGIGGGISISGFTVAPAEIIDNVISDNESIAGGGISIGSANPIVKRNIIKGNRVSVTNGAIGSGRGGGIYMDSTADALIVQNLITGNQASAGGGIYSSSGVIVNNTIAGNDGPIFGSGIYADGSNGLQLTNNIILANPGQTALYCNTTGALSARFNNIFSPGGPAYGGACSDRTGTDGNISADPLFIAPTQGNYHLQQLSPSIDAGDNLTPNLLDTDIDGDSRILDGDGDGTATIDMGVDEFLLPPGSTTPISTITFPKVGATIAPGTTVSITGLARDAGGGTVARVEVSVDGGATWNLATGTTAWSYNWTPATPGQATIRSRAVDDSENVQDPPAEITVTVRTPVTISVPLHQLTIQAAIDVANDGDTVMVAPGTYPENINFRGKAITVRSESGLPQDTTIDGGNADSVVTFNSGEGRDSVLNGFTLQNGRAPTNYQGATNGGGVKIENSSPTITNNEIKNNHACSGGGVWISSGSPLIQRNTIINNDANLCRKVEGGGGISIQGASSVEILDNVISNNEGRVLGWPKFGGGIYMSGAGTLIVKRNIIKGNNGSEGEGGGIWFGPYSNALIVQNLITGNQASYGAGLSGESFPGIPGPRLLNNTIADNDAISIGSGILASGFGDGMELINNIIVARPGQPGLECWPGAFPTPPTLRFNNIFSSGGPAYGVACSDRTGTDGNISADPLFTDPTQGDYHLQQLSPSIDTGDNTALNLPDKDLDGNPRIQDGDGNGTATIDMGVYEFLLPPGSTKPVSIIRSPVQGVTVPAGTTISITGLARDAGGGNVARVEVSVDGGATWNLATGTTAWSYDWTPTTPGPTLIRSRAVDDSENVQDPPAEITVTVRTPVIISVPSEQLTIQAAIDVAEIGDTVRVAPGIYHENINFRGKAITVRSESGLPQDTTIDGGDADSVITFNSGEGRLSTLNGFTLQNGRGPVFNGGISSGGGIVIRNSSPTITNNKITNNHACAGAGIEIDGGSPLIQMNTITNNDASLCSGEGGGGGIIILETSSAEILDNVISGNKGLSGGGIYISNDVEALIIQNLITGNQASAGGGIYSITGKGVIVNNTIADNDVTTNGSAIYTDGIDASVELTNNIIVAKPGQSGLYCGNLSGQNQTIIRFNNIFSAGGMAYGGGCSDRTGTDGNISADPLFTNPTQGDYHLQQSSLSIDSGDNQAPNLPDKDPDGHPRILDGDGNGTTIVDMGVYEFLLPTALRRLFR